MIALQRNEIIKSNQEILKANYKRLQERLFTTTIALCVCSKHIFQSSLSAVIAEEVVNSLTKKVTWLSKFVL